MQPMAEDDPTVAVVVDEALEGTLFGSQRDITQADAGMPLIKALTAPAGGIVDRYSTTQKVASDDLVAIRTISFGGYG